MTEDEYKAAMAEALALIQIDPAPGTPEGNRLLALADLIEPYEEEHFGHL